MTRQSQRLISYAVLVFLMACNLSPKSLLPTPTSTPDSQATAQAGEIATQQVIGEDFVAKHGFAARLTGNGQFGAAVVHQDGEKLIAMTETDATGNITKVTGAVWQAQDGSSLVVYNGPDGLPAKAVAGDYLLMFYNYTDSTVDVTVSSPDGMLTAVQGVAVDPAMLSELKLAYTPGEVTLIGNSQYQAGQPGLLRTIKLATFAVSVAGCVGTVIISPATGFALLAAAALPCGSALVNGILLLQPEEEPALAATGYTLGGIQCATGGVGECVTLAIDAAVDLKAAADEKIAAHDTALRIAITASTMRLDQGGCVDISWVVENGASVMFQGTAVEASGTRHECPTSTTTYILSADGANGRESKDITIEVVARPEPTISFVANTVNIRSGECATIGWDVQNAQRVLFNDVEVAAKGLEIVCPSASRGYSLRVFGFAGVWIEKWMMINVSGSY